jgi:polysaccharide export outer membrane protein
VSATRRIEIFRPIGMTGSGLRRRLSQPVAGFTMLAFFAVAVPAPGMAQLPTFSPGGTTRVNAGQLNEAYTLGGGDRLRLDIFDVPEYSGEYVVLVDGTLNLPVIGSVSVRGLTIQTATQIISNQYARYLKRPIVTLSLLAPRPVTLAVAGEVNRPGTYTVPIAQGGGQGGQGGQFPTVTQAITLAGGITQAAAIRNVEIRRRATSATEQVITVNLWELLQAGNLSQDISLRDGDTVFIPTVAAVNPDETRQLADASFASKEITPINIAVVGEVARPGPYSVTGGGQGTGGATGAVTGRETGVATGGGTAGPPTVTKAIQVAGGITSLADIRSITIRRTTRSGEARVINVDLWDLLRSGDLSEDVILQEGDTITIPTATVLDPAEANQLAGASFSPNTIVVNVVGEVERGGAIPVPPNTPLNQAILAAGGFNVRARKRSVELIRLNPNGTVEKRAIEVDLAQGINSQGNPTLRNNDVVVVKRTALASIGDTLGTVLNPLGSFVNLLRLFGF